MDLFKRKLTIDELMKILVKACNDINELTKKFISEKFALSKEDKKLNFETMIFSLWMISIIIPTNKYKDIFHEKFFKQFDFDEDHLMCIYDEMEKRYENLTYAYNMWISNPANGSILGSVMVETIINRNSEFTIQETFPKTDASLNAKMFEIFSKTFEITLGYLGEIKQKRKFPDLNK